MLPFAALKAEGNSAPRAEPKGAVLIVDDNPNNLALLGDILEGAGYRVRAASEGEQAIQLASKRLPDLILLDIQMPGVDGYEVCRRLRQEVATRDTPVIMISALDDLEAKVKAFDHGAVDYVTKPFQAAEVLGRVGAHLQLVQLRRHLLRKQAELEQHVAELQRKNEELGEAHRRTERVFSALAAALPGTVLDDKYRLDEEIGAGGFAKVFRAEHLQLKRRVAVKVLRPWAGNDAPAAVERFRREGVATCLLKHPNAVSVLDCGISESGIAYLVMELLEGTTLHAFLKETMPLSPARCAEILRPVCEVLAAAHEADLVHRDIKPENIFLHRSPNGEVVKVLDFGIAKIVSEGEPAEAAPQLTRGIVGTPAYLAPERLMGESYDGRADVYAVGVLLYLMMSGHLPFAITKDPSPWVAAMNSIKKEPSPMGPAIPDAAERLVMRALAKDPADRPTAREMAEALAGWSRRFAASGMTPSPPTRS